MDNGAFRFIYFTTKYKETIEFYAQKLELEELHSWNRDENDKGTLFRAGGGAIEILLWQDPENQVKGLDYRQPQGVFTGIKVEDAEGLYKQYAKKSVPLKEHITEQEWGHKSFSIIEPNGLVILMFEETF